jgi:hypothetical protein
MKNAKNHNGLVVVSLFLFVLMVTLFCDNSKAQSSSLPFTLTRIGSLPLEDPISDDRTKCDVQIVVSSQPAFCPGVPDTCCCRRVGFTVNGHPHWNICQLRVTFSDINNFPINPLCDICNLSKPLWDVDWQPNGFILDYIGVRMFPPDTNFWLRRNQNDTLWGNVCAGKSSGFVKIKAEFGACGEYEHHCDDEVLVMYDGNCITQVVPTNISKDIAFSDPYPNPANSIQSVYVECTKKQELKVQIVGVNGSDSYSSSIITVENGKYLLDFDTKNIPNGSYYLSIKSSENNYFKQVLIVH